MRSAKFDIYYIGQTKNLESRLKTHNGSKARWTKRYQPWVLEYFEEFSERSDAVKRERYLKSLKNVGRHLELNKSGKL